MRRPLCILAALLGAAGATHAQAPASARIDSVFQAFEAAGSPGCAVGVVRDGAIVYQRGYGFANLDHGIRNGPDIVYYVGSVSKQFTAAAIALLAQEGRIGLDDDVRRYVPELPDYGEPITVRQLVNHTSGLRDIYVLMSLAGLRLEDVFTDDDALALIARQRELNFAPGTDYLYSNSGYFLLGQIVERVTGQSLREYADAKIFQPLGMTHTHFHDQPWRVVPNRASSYEPGPDGFRINYLANFDKVGAGGLYSTIGDLAKWDANFYEPTVGGAPLLETLHTRAVLDRGDTISYAFGLVVEPVRGLPTVRHSGAMMGFRSDFVRFPTERTSVITLCNVSTSNPTALNDRVAALVLGDRLAPPPARPQAANAAARPAAAPSAYTPAELAAFTGRYWSEELQAAYDVAVTGDTLRLTRRPAGTQPLRPAGADRFTAAGHTLAFERDAAGAVTGFTVEAGRVRNIRFARRPPAP